MKSRNKYIYYGITIIWYFSIIFYSLGLIYAFSKTTLPISSDSLLLTILYFIRHLVISIPFLFCIFQLRKIVLSLLNNTFFSFKIAHRFRNIGYAIMFINFKIIIDIIYHFNSFIVANNSGITITVKGDLLKEYIKSIFLSVESPIITFLTLLILGFIFILISQVLKQSAIMKNEIDQTV